LAVSLLVTGKEANMSFREVDVFEVREVLRCWMAGQGLRKAAEAAGVDRKTARRYVRAAEEAGWCRESGREIDDELIGVVIAAVRPGRPSGHGAAWEALEARRDRLTAWVEGRDPDRPEEPKGRPLTAAKITELLAREGCVAPYRTVHRFLSQRCGYRPVKTTVRVADGVPGEEVQADFGYLGLMFDRETGRRRKVHALVLTAVVSRHMFVWLTFSQTLAAVIAGCEAAWRFFGGRFKVMIPDNLTPVVKDADRTNPVFQAGWLDYQQHAGFFTDPARVRAPQDKPRVERSIAYVKSNMWDGEHFESLVEARAYAERWCREIAGTRIHGTHRQRPVDVFDQLEASVLLPVPAPYDWPIIADVKVARDLHFQVGKALYSAPAHLVGQTLRVRADSRLVKAWHKGVLVKTHPRMDPGGRSTDRADLPEHKTAYALRDTASMIRRAQAQGDAIGVYAERLLDVDLPWTRMRRVHQLLSLARRYGPDPVDQACRTALDLDVVDVAKIARMLDQATEQVQPALPVTAVQGGRFARPAGHYAAGHRRLTVVPSSQEPLP